MIKFANLRGKQLLYETSTVLAESTNKKKDYSDDDCESAKYRMCSHPYDCIWTVEISDVHSLVGRVTCTVGVKPYIRELESIKEE